MLRRLPVVFACFAVIFSCCVAAFAQETSARAAGATSEGLPVYLPTVRETLAQHVDYPGCFCANAFPECLKPVKRPSFARSRFSFFASTSEIQQIDLEGLKKLIQRDPKDTRPLLVNFWATWCDPCREEFPDLVKIDADYRSKGLNFVAVSLDDVGDIKTKVEPFLKEMKATMPVVLLNVNDPEPAIHAVDPNWQGDMPATFLYDKEGKVVFKHFGPIKAAELRAAIDKEVGNKQ